MILQTVTIPQYIRKVKLSNARKKKYFVKGKHEPKPSIKKYQDRTKFDWRPHGKEQRLVDLEKNEFALANPKAAGTPKHTVINGQKMYNGEYNSFTRIKVMEEIKKQMIPFINKMKVIEEFPINIDLEIHDVMYEEGSSSLWDGDNRGYPYIKAFQDCLSGGTTEKVACKQIIPDDNILFVSKSPGVKIIPVEDPSERKLVFIISKETDKRIVENKEYCNELKVKLDEFRRISVGNQQNMEDGNGSERTTPLPFRGFRRSR